MPLAHNLSAQGGRMKFLRDIKGQGLIEWLTAAIIIIAVVGGVLLAIANSLKNRLEAVNNEL